MNGLWWNFAEWWVTHQGPTVILAMIGFRIRIMILYAQLLYWVRCVRQVAASFLAEGCAVPAPNFQLLSYYLICVFSSVQLLIGQDQPERWVAYSVTWVFVCVGLLQALLRVRNNRHARVGQLHYSFAFLLIYLFYKLHWTIVNSNCSLVFSVGYTKKLLKLGK